MNKLHQAIQDLLDADSLPFKKMSELAKQQCFVSLLEITQVHSLRQQASSPYLGHAPFIFWSMNAAGLITQSEGAGLARLGLQAGELVGQSLFTLYADYPAVIDNVRRALNGEPVSYLAQLGDVYFDCYLQPVWDHNQQVQSVTGFGFDVTEIKRKEYQLMQQQARYQKFVELAQEGIWVIDAQYRTSFANPKMAQMLGFERPEQMLGTTLFEHMDENAQGLAYKVLERRQGLEEDCEFAFKTQQGQELWAHLVTTAIWSENGEYEGTLAMVSDITSTKALYDELALARRMAEASNQAKSRYLANMSHEIRTPLNAILGFAQILMREASLQTEHKQMVDMILQGGEHLHKLINDVLDLAKIESGKMELRREEFDLQELLEYIEAVYLPQCVQKDLQFEVACPAELRHHFDGDLVKLRQILFNLLNNALKFTERGSIRLHCAVSPLESAAGEAMYQLGFTLTDTGSGMSASELEQVFEEFTQAKEGLEHEGSGLGLTITKALVEFMGGQIEARSQPQQGSEFRFWVPMPLGEPLRPAFRATEPDALRLVTGGPDYRVLVADDHAANALVLQKMLETAGYQVQCVGNGVEALELVRSWQPHALLIDRKMPEMDGLEACQQLRALPGSEKLVILMISASAFLEEQEAVLQSGLIDDYICKPFRVDDILLTLREHLHVEYQPLQQGESDTQPFTARLAYLQSCTQQQLQQLREACINSDYDYLITEFQAFDSPCLAEFLRVLNSFDYETLLSEIEQALTSVTALSPKAPQRN